METRAPVMVMYPLDDPKCYPVHEEVEVVESMIHYLITHYLDDVLSVHVADGWVGGEICCYWIPGDYET